MNRSNSDYINKVVCCHHSGLLFSLYKIIMKINCLNCWKEIEQVQKTQKFCSRKCKDFWRHHHPIEKRCKYCGNTFEWNENTDYCSKECRDKWRVANLKKTMRKIYNVDTAAHFNRIEKKCEVCWRVFVTFKSHAKYCCDKCKWIARRNRPKERTCAWCGKKFIWTITKKCCSEECTHALHIYNMEQTNLKKYNETSPMKTEECKRKRIQTNIKKFWKENPMQTEECKKKQIQTNIKKYWKENFMQTDVWKEKRHKSFKENHWVDYMLQSKEILNKSIATNMKNNWVPYYCMTDECKKAGSANSKENKKFREFLREHWIQWIEDDKELALESYSYDIPIWQTLIEVSPRPYHNLTMCKKQPIIAKNCKRLEELQKKARENGLTNEEKKEKSNILKRRREKEKYHKDKTICAREHWYKCITIFNWDDREKIIYLLEGNKEKIYARKCEVKQITYEEAHQLFEAYHLQWDTAKNKNNIYIGLIYKWNLIMAMSFWKPRYTDDYEREILRLCTHKDYSIIWGASKIFKHFVELVEPNSVISYCDMGKFDGKVYEQIWFDLLQRNSPSRHRRFTGISRPEKKKLEKELWYEIFIPNDKHIHFTDNQINLARWFDQLLWKYFGTFGKWTRNDELLRKFHYVEVYDCGQATYVRHKEKEER